MSKLNQAFDLLGRTQAQNKEAPQSVHLAAREDRLGEVLAQGAGADVMPRITEVSEVTRDDLLALRTTETDVLGLRYSHHEVARLLALGMSGLQVERATGIAKETISSLTRTPSFQALIAQYREQELGSLNALVRDRLTTILMDTLTELHGRVEEGKAKTSELTKITEMLLDRTGHSPVQKSMHVNVGLGAQTLQAVKETVRASLARPPEGEEEEE